MPNDQSTAEHIKEQNECDKGPLCPIDTEVPHYHNGDEVIFGRWWWQGSASDV